MSKKMTPWFPHDIKPAHKGVYEIKFHYQTGTKDPMYATWNGKRWSNFSYYLSSHWHNIFRGATQTKCWRGFVEQQ